MEVAVSHRIIDALNRLLEGTMIVRGEIEDVPERQSVKVGFELRGQDLGAFVQKLEAAARKVDAGRISSEDLFDRALGESPMDTVLDGD